MSKLDTIEKLVRGVDDYLNSNQLNQICSSSIGHNELKQALTALTELRKEMEWQPIETAPKDGTNVDLYGTYKGYKYRITDCRFIPLEGYWFAVNSMMGNGFVPTHWHPLPQPPKKASE